LGRGGFFFFFPLSLGPCLLLVFDCGGFLNGNSFLLETFLGTKSLGGSGGHSARLRYPFNGWEASCLVFFFCSPHKGATVFVFPFMPPFLLGVCMVGRLSFLDVSFCFRGLFILGFLYFFVVGEKSLLNVRLKSRPYPHFQTRFPPATISKRVPPADLFFPSPSRKLGISKGFQTWAFAHYLGEETGSTFTARLQPPPHCFF